VLEITDVVVIESDLQSVFYWLWRAERWPEITPHVKRVQILEEEKDRQHFRMDVLSDGKIHTVETQRQARPYGSICYRQIRPPEFLREHSGEWVLRRMGSGTEVKVVHRADVDEEKAVASLGVASAADARERVRLALSRNGKLTLEVIKNLLESQLSPLAGQQG
jgi:aromatase